jgi:small nuclear ribonucleoprotein (snRNP)-like protein
MCENACLSSLVGRNAPYGCYEQKDPDLFETGPLEMLTQAVKTNSQVISDCAVVQSVHNYVFASPTLLRQVLINCRNNKKLLARVKAFDRHCNMVTTADAVAGYSDNSCGRSKTNRLNPFVQLVQVLENVKEMWTEVPKVTRKLPRLADMGH